VAGDAVFESDNWNGHITASALVVNPSMSSALFIKSRKYLKYLLPGGHIELGESTLCTAQRELKEETGLDDVSKLHLGEKSTIWLPIEINTHQISGNNAKCRPRHTHHDFVHLFQAGKFWHEVAKESLEASEIEWRPIASLQENYRRSYDRLLQISER
jgi:8-oxo-dGTP pyrophosphatase MutT (NUDIX family)